MDTGEEARDTLDNQCAQDDAGIIATGALATSNHSSGVRAKGNFEWLKTTKTPHPEE